MNFLSHFYFDRYTADNLQVVGIILPDLIKNARKEWNIHPEKLEERFSNESSLYSLLKGWNRHLEVDKYFHSSDFFKEHTHNIRTEIAPALKNAPSRPSFVAHIALELMLDSLLLNEQLIDVNSFYQLLSQSDRLAVQQFLTLNDIREHDIFFHFFDEFLKAGYLNSYREARNIMYALNRICMRVWPGHRFSAKQELQLTAIITDYQTQLRKDFMQIFDQIDVQLNQCIF